MRRDGPSAPTSAPRGGTDLELYLLTLAGQSGHRRYFDIRWARANDTMSRRFISATHVETATRLIRRLAVSTDVYVGVALRDSRAHGGKRAIGGSHLLYVECDEPLGDGGRTLAHPPTLEVASGTPGHLHLYWRLDRRVPGDEVEAANLRLALALGGDTASVDLARVLRPPTSLNHKHDPPQPVRLLAYRVRAVYGLAELTTGLPEPWPGVTAGTRTHLPSRRTALDLGLLAIPAARYAEALAGRTPNRAGKIACPFHDDRRPSMQLYPDGSFYCFGCRRGGTIYDFAAEVFRTGTRGSEFLALRERLRALFAIDGGARAERPPRRGERTPSRPAHRLRDA